MNKEYDRILISVTPIKGEFVQYSGTTKEWEFTEYENNICLMYENENKTKKITFMKNNIISFEIEYFNNWGMNNGKNNINIKKFI